MYVCIYVYVCMHTRMGVDTYIRHGILCAAVNRPRSPVCRYVYMYMCKYVHVCMHTRMCVDTYICICVDTYMYVCIYVCVQIRIYVTVSYV